MLASLLQACTPLAPVPEGGICGAAGLQGLVGSPVAQLPADGPWGVLRVIGPGQLVTMDYSESRLNVMVDEGDIILTIACG